MRAFHDSANVRYRYPLGSLRTGDKVYLGIRITDADILSVYLHITGEGYENHIELSHSGELWFADIVMPDEPAAYFYYFMINTPGGVFYYCGDYQYHCGAGELLTSPSGAFQITVYDADFSVPDFMKTSVMYQIFPDRFKRGNEENLKRGYAYHTSLGRDIRVHEDFSEPADYLPREGEEHYTPNDFFGGDLEGITSSLDYLRSLGVDVIYLNPIFESASNHRYDTADYMNIDPFLGTEEDFLRLIAEARSRGIRVILDGVFSHTGDDSRYFDKYSRYEETGAHENPASEFMSWYTFFDYPDNYKTWWGFKTLPEVNKEDPGWREFAITGEDSVIAHWLKRGASGFRLDVADELPDDVIELMRAVIKKRGGALIGEVWEDATTKQSYGNVRKYAFGRALDSVMNYPLRNAVVDFLMCRTGARDLSRFLLSQWQNYPRPMYHALMNLLSSHDIPRILTALTAPAEAVNMPRERQAHYVVTKSVLEHAVVLNKIAAALIFCLPGMPSIYYGDETGMQGLSDPFNRQTFRSEISELTEFYKKISAIRHNEQALTVGGVCFRAVDDDILAVVRYFDGETIVFAVNRSTVNRRVVFDVLGSDECFSAEDKREIANKKHTRALSLLTGAETECVSELIDLELLPFGFDILKLK